MLNVTPKDYAEGKTFYENLKKSNSSNLGYLKNIVSQIKVSEMLKWSKSKTSRMISGNTKGNLADRMKIYQINEKILCFLLVNQRELIKKLKKDINEATEFSLIAKESE